MKNRKTITTPVFVDYCFLVRGKGTGVDGDNMQGGISDVLEKAGVIENDKLVRSWCGRIIAGQPEYVTQVSIQLL